MTTDLSREVDLAIEAIRYICVKSNVPETVMGAICHEVREHLAQPEQTINAVGQVDSHLNQPTQSFIGSAPEPVPAAPIQDAPSAGDAPPTVSELEAILKDESYRPMEILPNGEIRAGKSYQSLAAEVERLRHDATMLSIEKGQLKESLASAESEAAELRSTLEHERDRNRQKVLAARKDADELRARLADCVEAMRLAKGVLRVDQSDGHRRIAAKLDAAMLAAAKGDGNG